MVTLKYGHPENHGHPISFEWSNIALIQLTNQLSLGMWSPYSKDLPQQLYL